MACCEESLNFKTVSMREQLVLFIQIIICKEPNLKHGINYGGKE